MYIKGLHSVLYPGNPKNTIFVIGACNSEYNPLHLQIFTSIWLESTKPVSQSISDFLAANIISGMVFGKRFEYTDAELLQINDAFDVGVQINVIATVFRNLPFLKYLPIDLTSKIFCLPMLSQ